MSKNIKRSLSKPTIKFVESWLNELKKDSPSILSGNDQDRLLFSDLIGEIVLSITISDDGESSNVTFECYGDCCSQTWISDFYGFSKLIGYPVLSVTSIDLYDRYDVEDGRTKQEFDAVYGYKFNTKAGCSVLAFRNSSNGGYGGKLVRKKLNTNTFHIIQPDKNYDFWQAD